MSLRILAEGLIAVTLDLLDIGWLHIFGAPLPIIAAAKFVFLWNTVGHKLLAVGAGINTFTPATALPDTTALWVVGRFTGVAL